MKTSVSAPHSSSPLARVVGLPGAALLGLGSILGTGVFVSLALAADVAGAAVVPAVVLAALVATANGLSSASLAAAHPVSGGTYEYGYRFVHPLAGFTAGWMYLVAKSASAATAALGCVAYALHLVGVEVAPAARVGLASALVVAVTALAATGLRRSNRVNAVLVATTLGALGVFVVAALADVPPADAAARLAPGADAGRVTLPSVLEATALLFVAYTGYGRVATLGEEVRDPSRVIPRAVVLTLAVSMAVYVAVAVAAVGAVGAPAFGQLATGTAAPLDALLRALDRPVAAGVVAFGAVTAMAGVLLNLVLGLSRVLLAMARRGDAPSRLARVSGRGPAAAVVVMGSVVALITLVGDVRLTWSFSAVTVLVYYGLTNLAALRLPASERRVPRWVAVAGLVGCFGLAGFVDVGVVVAAAGIMGVGLIGRAAMRRAHG